MASGDGKLFYIASLTLHRTGGFPLSDIGSCYLKLLKILKHESYYVRVDISVDAGTVIVIFRPKSRDIFPYRIQNDTENTITYWQEEVVILHDLY